GAGIRTIVDKKLSFVYTSDFRRDALARLVERAIALAHEASPDEFNKLPSEKPRKVVMEIFDSELRSISLKRKIALIRDIEAAALAHDALIKRSDGAQYNEFYGTTEIANSHGLLYSFDSSNCTASVGAVAEKDGKMEAGYAQWSSPYFKRLPPPPVLGRKAAHEAVRLLGAKPVPTQKAPVVFDPELGFALLAALGQALNGEEVNKGTSYMADKIGQRIGSDLVTIHDNGRLAQGSVSRPVDAEGVSTSDLVLVEKGILKSFIYDYRSALKAGKKPTGNAVRGGYSNLPGVGFSNHYMEKGASKSEDIIKSTQSGFYATRLSGWWLGLSPANPEFSSAASGLWIRNGELAEPVSGVTIGSTIPDMLAGIDALGDDLVFSGATRCPTFRVREMSISGVSDAG
ncbi:MAG: TldD/PmbA family protein, partial [Candidatus Eisenbacteria bacterium]